MSRRAVITLAIGGCAIVAALGVRTVFGDQDVRPAPEVPLPKLLALVPENLRYEPLGLESADNGWAALASAVAETPEMTFELQERVGAGMDMIKDSEKVLSAYNSSMASVAKAAMMPRASISTLEGKEGPAHVVERLRRFVTLFGVRARSRLRAGDVKGAVADFESALNIATRIPQAGAPVDYAVISSSLVSRVCRDMRVGARDKSVSDEDLSQLLAAVPASDVMNEAFKQAIKGELYWFIKDELMRLGGPGLTSKAAREGVRSPKDIATGWIEADNVAAALLDGHREPFLREETVTAASTIYSELLQNVDRSWTAQADTSKMMQDLVAEWPRMRLMGGNGLSDPEKAEMAETRPKLLAAKNPYGRFALWYFMNVSNQSTMASFRAKADLSATRIILALRIHEKRTGHLPSSLSELESQKILTKVPHDPFGDRAFRYDSKSRRLWSVGPNGRDEEGAGGSLSPRSPDFVWFIEAN